VDGHTHRKRRRADRIATTAIFGREEEESFLDALITKYEIAIYVTVVSTAELTTTVSKAEEGIGSDDGRVPSGPNKNIKLLLT